LKSFRRKDEDKGDQPPPDDPGNPSVDFRGETRTNETHESKTDPEAKLMRKSPGTTAKLSFAAHALMENRNGLVVDVCVNEANGHAEREAALEMLGRIPGSHRVTVGCDKAYDTRDFVDACRMDRVTPHVAKNEHVRRRSAIDGRTTSHPGYGISMRIRKRIEEVWGWMKTVGNFRKTRYKGVQRTRDAAYFLASAFNLLRMAKLLGEAS
jgi:IS5 family transposase